MPDNTRPLRHLVDPDPRPPLGVRAVMNAIEQLAQVPGLQGSRVVYKRKSQEEHVVALIFPPQPP
jgi:hypothetical protein